MISDLILGVAEARLCLTTLRGAALHCSVRSFTPCDTVALVQRIF